MAGYFNSGIDNQNQFKNSFNNRKSSLQPDREVIKRFTGETSDAAT